MPQVSHLDFLKDCQSSNPIKIKVFNLGENLGMDFAFFCHYHYLKKAFPNVTIDLCRSNVDETNCIGLEHHAGRAVLPVDSLHVAKVCERYPDGQGWVHKVASGDISIFPAGFVDATGYDYIWTIGMASSPAWRDRYQSLKLIDSPTVRHAMETYQRETHFFPEYDEILDLGPGIKPWERTRLEHLVSWSDDYPFTFTHEFLNSPLSTQYQDYLRVGLRWPDHVRWYYSIDRQYEVLFQIIHRIRNAGKPVKIIYNLKDGEVNNNFNRGQSLDRLRALQSLCDDVLYTYSWPDKPRSGRPSEAQERGNLASVGIHNIKRVDIWEDLLMSTFCKVYLSDPGGFAEVISMTRKNPDSTFLFPVSYGHASTYISLDMDEKPVHLKVNPVVIQQCYSCEATLNPPEEQPRRVTHWDVGFRGQSYRIGNDCHGDDWKYFEEAQQTVFREMYEMTKDDLIDAVVREYLR